MSAAPATPIKRNPNKRCLTTSIKRLKTSNVNNNNTTTSTDRLQARNFVSWYRRMIDHDRDNLGLYFADNSTMEWFGRTIQTRKKVATFLKYDMQCSRHDFTSVESIEQLETRQYRDERNISREGSLASPHSPEVLKIRPDTVDTGNSRKRSLRARCKSPEWASGCGPDSSEHNAAKRLRGNGDNRDDICDSTRVIKDVRNNEEISDVNNKGDGVTRRGLKRKCAQVTPPNCEVGQGDCLPSTSTSSPLNTPKKAVECNGYIEFSRTKNSRTTDAMKWERKCKVQISYSEDPYNAGEYIIWEIHYTDENKCRRNLLAAFEEVSLQESLKN